MKSKESNNKNLFRLFFFFDGHLKFNIRDDGKRRK